MSHGLLGRDDLLQRRAPGLRAIQRPLLRKNERLFGDDAGRCELAGGKAPSVALDREHLPGVRPIGFSYAEYELAALVAAPGEHLRVVVGGEVDALLRCYGDSLTRLRSGRTGVLLQPDPDVHAGLLHAALPRRDELPSCPGRGWVIGPAGATPAQVALP